MNGPGGITCGRCGHQNPLGARFCSSCGAELETVTEQATAALDPIGDEPEVAGWEAALVATSGHRAGARWPIEGDVVRAGRHPDSDVFLDDITVSRRHVEIERHGATWLVRDAGSLNGTYLNGARVDESALRSGDELQIGKFKLLFVIREVE